MAAERRYWLGLFSHGTWNTFVANGAHTIGFRENRWPIVQKLKPGDYVLAYLTGVSRWIGALVVTGEPFFDASPLWAEDVLPARVKVKPLVMLTPETAVPIAELRDKLTLFRKLKNPNAWTGRLRGAPARWTRGDGEAVVEALLDAQVNPVVREVDGRKLARKPALLGAARFSVALPDHDVQAVNVSGFREPASHTEIQWLLLKLGSDLGLDVWVARNDRGRRYGNQRFLDLPRLRAELPRQFDAATTRIVELIDVLWLQGNAIVAAFEIESTTSIYSGLLRLADLVAMQPNLHIPLYLVAPDERRRKVCAEINRPAFNRLAPPLNRICRFIAFSTLRTQIQEAQPVLRYLRAEFIDQIAESCLSSPLPAPKRAGA